MIRYRIHQNTKRDGTWTAPFPAEAREHRHIAQAIIAGFLSGEARWATNEDTGAFIYGLDAKGKEITEAPPTIPGPFSKGVGQ